MLRLEGIYKIYKPEVVALKNISLTINKGEFVALIGSSGSGKSTLMHILGCLDIPTSGRYFFFDEEVNRLKDRELALIRNKKIGFIFQTFNLLPRLSALKNVELPLFYAKIPKRKRSEKADALLRQVGLEKRLTHVPAKLSGGEQQRVAIARALANHPELILADEPTGNLDTQTGKEIMEIFAGLHKQGTTIVVVTHDSRIASYAKRVIKLKDGMIET